MKVSTDKPQYAEQSQRLQKLVRLYSQQARIRLGRYEQDRLSLNPDALFARMRAGAAANPGGFAALFDKIQTDGLGMDAAFAVFEGICQGLADAKQPDPGLGHTLLAWLDGQAFLWQRPRLSAHGLKLAAGCVCLTGPAEGLLYLLIRFSDHPDPEAPSAPTAEESDRIAAESVRGLLARTAMILACRLCQAQMPPLPLLFPLLFRFATDPHPGVRQALLADLVEFAAYQPEKGFKLFEALYQPWPALPALWQAGAAYMRGVGESDFARLAPYLSRMRQAAPQQTARLRGELLALGYLSDQVSASRVLSQVESEPSLLAGILGALEARMEGPDRLCRIRSLLSPLIQRGVADPEIPPILKRIAQRSVHWPGPARWAIAYGLAVRFCRTPIPSWFDRHLADWLHTAPLWGLALCQVLADAIHTAPQPAIRARYLRQYIQTVLEGGEKSHPPHLISQALLLQNRLMEFPGESIPAERTDRTYV